MRTASGATAVQIVLNRHGTRTIVEHVGSAHTDAELAVLIQTAWGIHQQSQQAFDLDGLEPSAPAAPVTVVGSSSRVLWEILEQAYAALGLMRWATTSSRNSCLAGWSSRSRKRTPSGCWASWE